MADEAFERAGLHFDELNKIRVIDPQVAQETTDIKDESKEFISKLKEFQTLTDNFESVQAAAAKHVENEKLKAIAARNLVNSLAKERESQQEQMKVLIIEKKMELERLKVQLESLQRVEAEQNDFIEQFSLHK